MSTRTNATCYSRKSPTKSSWFRKTSKVARLKTIHNLNIQISTSRWPRLQIWNLLHSHHKAISLPTRRNSPALLRVNCYLFHFSALRKKSLLWRNPVTKRVYRRMDRSLCEILTNNRTRQVEQDAKRKFILRKTFWSIRHRCVSYLASPRAMHAHSPT